MALPPGLARVVVLRALMLGDLLCATPALRALRAGLPQARITLVGLPWARELVSRLASVDEFVELPGWPGLPERTAAPRAEQLAFLAAMRARRWHLAVQMHGSGAVVNPLLAAFGARLNAGFAAPGAPRPGADRRRFIAWPEQGRETGRLLALTDALGLRRAGDALDFPLRPGDHERAAALLGPGRWVLVHAGAQLPSRRWPAERFAAVADGLAAGGWRVALTGTEGERALVAAVAAAMRHPALELAGRSDLWTLGALVARAALVVCNDTGLSHVAAALGTPSVVVASGSDVARWAPADARRHRVLWHEVECRPCAHAVCPTAHECALGVRVDMVLDAARAALENADA